MESEPCPIPSGNRGLPAATRPPTSPSPALRPTDAAGWLGALRELAGRGDDLLAREAALWPTRRRPGATTAASSSPRATTAARAARARVRPTPSSTSPPRRRRRYGGTEAGAGGMGRSRGALTTRSTRWSLPTAASEAQTQPGNIAAGDPPAAMLGEGGDDPPLPLAAHRGEPDDHRPLLPRQRHRDERRAVRRPLPAEAEIGERVAVAIGDEAPHHRDVAAALGDARAQPGRGEEREEIVAAERQVEEHHRLGGEGRERHRRRARRSDAPRRRAACGGSAASGAKATSGGISRS